MNPHPDPPMHKVVINFRSYTLNNAVRPRQAQPKPGPNIVHPTSPGKDEVADSLSPLGHPGEPLMSIDPFLNPDKYVDHRTGPVEQLYPTHITAEYAWVPNQFVVPTYGTNVNHSVCCNEIQHHPSTPYAPDSNITGVGTGLAKAGDETVQKNPSTRPQKKPHINEYANCAPKKCLYPGPDEKRCLQVITCALVPKHFICHGITNKSRDEKITCQWDGCFEKVVRHNFVRHIREKHLRHTRGSAVHGSEKERRQRTFNI